MVFYSVIFVIVNKVFISNSNILNWLNILAKLNYEAKATLKIKTVTMIYLSTFIFILILNVAALLPYVIAANSHLRVSLSLSLTLWLRIILYGVIKAKDTLIRHLVPYGCPGNLIFFMVIIETVRILIRPLTLAVRLSANIIAGHVILALVSSASLINFYN